MSFHDAMPLGEARDILRELVDDGAECPCCKQFAKVYRRKVNSSMARGLIAIWRSCGTEWCYLPDVRGRVFKGDNREESKLRYWDLLEEEAELRPDGGRAGVWRITPAGERWVNNGSNIPKYARIYNKRLLGLTGEPVSIVDALGTKFNYRDLMDGV